MKTVKKAKAGEKVVRETLVATEARAARKYAPMTQQEWAEEEAVDAENAFCDALEAEKVPSTYEALENKYLEAERAHKVKPTQETGEAYTLALSRLEYALYLRQAVVITVSERECALLPSEALGIVKEELQILLRATLSNYEEYYACEKALKAVRKKLDRMRWSSGDGCA